MKHALAIAFGLLSSLATVAGKGPDIDARGGAGTDWADEDDGERAVRFFGIAGAQGAPFRELVRESEAIAGLGGIARLAGILERGRDERSS
jgi:hypothetical protein